MKASSLDYHIAYPSARSPVMGRNMVSTSQPLAAQAGLAMLHKGGNAVDAALATAMTLTVVEPTGCGLGSDAFAIVWDGKRLHGLNGSGRSPAAWTPERFAGRTVMPERGWEAVTTPGVVSAWMALHERFGTLPLEVIAAPAIGYARAGFSVTPIIATLWGRAATLLGDQPGFAEAFLPDGRAPRAGELFRSEAHASTLERIVASKGEAFYRGEIAEKIAAFAKQGGGALSLDDLGQHKADWVDLLSQDFTGGAVHELPPNGQGIATLIGLGLLQAYGIGKAPVDDVETVHAAIEATKIALADIYHFVADRQAMGIDPAALLDAGYLADRVRLIDPRRAGDPGHGQPRPGGTVYLSAADANGMMVSFIQSNYMGFGSGIVVPGTGISLQNRGAGFVLTPGHANQVGPRKRPFHTIIPGFATNADGSPLMSFGVMGGPIQAQGHLQMALRIMAYGQNPQAAADAPRWRVLAGRKIAVESSMNADLITALKSLGHEVVVEATDSSFAFGGAQIIVRDGESGHYIAGSDPRKDGQAVTF
ncbi:gamma-glutamyltransferase family protein [Telmatospirillum sp.]|uniref:gamma-glutamyltransferase family protein n=1 Tax=Telmatospirillum sp. TaxID=2079197 RepID=UPI00283DF9B9|nr:gamma-glutamyltransferase family protein [Telmatospirillum sp.]MDR3435160.1 gamma-glutamyltransferase family protein [Telmatospirillum sp.]